MAKEFDYLAAAKAAGMRLAGPLRRARTLFGAISRELGSPSAKLIFELCAREAVEASTPADKTPRREHIKLPTTAQIEGANRSKICAWWDRLRHTDQTFSDAERKIIHQLAGRYIEVGGYPSGYIEGKQPPIKRKGAKAHNPPGAKLPAMFDAMKAERNGNLTKERFAEIVVKVHGKTYGKNVEAVQRNERNWRKKNRKV